MMEIKKGARATARRGGGDDCIFGSIEIDGGGLVIRPPEVRVLRLVARSALLVSFVLYFPWIHATLRRGACDCSPAAPILPSSSSAVVSRALDDDDAYIPLLFQDLKRCGLFGPHQRALFLVNNLHQRELLFLEKNTIDPVFINHDLEHSMSTVPDLSIDFAFAWMDGFRRSDFTLIDRVLKVGGILALRSLPLPFPYRQYRMVYGRRLGSDVVAMKKTNNDPPISRPHSLIPIDDGSASLWGQS